MTIKKILHKIRFHFRDSCIRYYGKPFRSFWGCKKYNTGIIVSLGRIFISISTPCK
jgi:hypothetical protein